MFELVFWGGAGRYVRSILGNYKREHASFEAAQSAAHRLLRKPENDGIRAAHPAIIYGPGCGRDGYTIR